MFWKWLLIMKSLGWNWVISEHAKVLRYIPEWSIWVKNIQSEFFFFKTLEPRVRSEMLMKFQSEFLKIFQSKFLKRFRNEFWNVLGWTLKNFRSEIWKNFGLKFETISERNEINTILDMNSGMILWSKFRYENTTIMTILVMDIIW